MTILALFNNKGGVGKTTLTYHLAHMMSRQGQRILSVDLDPQSNLSAAFLDEEDLAFLWGEQPDPTWGNSQLRLFGPANSAAGEKCSTIADAVQPIMDGTGDVADCTPIPVADNLWLLSGDLRLSAFEDRLSEAWSRGFTGRDVAALRTTTAFYRIVRAAARNVAADLVLIDVGPNLGAINRAGLLAADAVLVPLAADLFSLRGLSNLGPRLREWRDDWQNTVLPRVVGGIPTPSGRMAPIGYVVMQPTMRLDRPVKAYHRWLERIPQVFASDVLGVAPGGGAGQHEIATLRNYQSLMPLAHDARKPMFDLRAADGALGSTQAYVQKCYEDFRDLANTLLARLVTLKSS